MVDVLREKSEPNEEFPAKVGNKFFNSIGRDNYDVSAKRVAPNQDQIAKDGIITGSRDAEFCYEILIYDLSSDQTITYKRDVLDQDFTKT